MNYSVEILDLVNNPNCQFYKLLIDDECLFDEFVKQVEKVKADKSSFAGIIALMDNYSPYQLMPRTKFRQIEAANKSERHDLYEFKKNNLRVYVILQCPNVYVAMGGYKATQEKDIRKLKKNTLDFPETFNT